MVPPTLDEAGIIIGASARLAGRGIVQGNGTIGDNRKVGLDEDANLLGDAAAAAAGTEATRRRDHGLAHRPAEGPGVERNCTPRAWGSFQHLDELPLDTAPEASAQPDTATGASDRTRSAGREQYDTPTASPAMSSRMPGTRADGDA